MGEWGRTTSGRGAHYPKMIRSVSGDYAEMLVAVELLRHGFFVFRAVAKHGPCDLIAMTPHGRVIRVEVATGTIAKADVPFMRKAATYAFDILAVVMPNDRIGYFRPNEERCSPEDF